MIPEDNLRIKDLKYKEKWAKSEDRLQLTVSVGTGLGDFIFSLKKEENTCLSSRIQTHNISFHVAEDLSAS